MKLPEAIAELEKLKEKHGDVEMTIHDDPDEVFGVRFRYRKERWPYVGANSGVVIVE